MLRPFSFYVKCFSLPDLFAGKMHALLFLQWKNRVKGHDWFDMEWYIRRGTALQLGHFAQRAKESGDLPAGRITHEQLLHLLEKKIKSVAFSAIKEDIVPFIPNPKLIEIWSPKYFTDLVQQLKTVS